MASSGRTFGLPSTGWISTRDAHRLENKTKQRAVISWDMTGSVFKGSRYVAGYTRLHLEGGGWMWFPENTKLDDAIAQAEDHGFEVTKVRADLDEWVRTGKGVSFRLVQP